MLKRLKLQLEGRHHSGIGMHRALSISEIFLKRQ